MRKLYTFFSPQIDIITKFLRSDHKSLLFTIYLLTILVGEGLGQTYIQTITRFVVLLFPVFFLFFLKKTFVITKLELLFFILLSVLHFCSVLFSIQKQNASESLLFFFSFFLMFLISREYHNIATKAIHRALWASFFIFPLTMLINYFLIQKKIYLLLPNSAFNYIYPTHGHHNHLGDLLSLSFTFFLFSFFQKKHLRYLLPLVVSFIFIATSFSRSAYVSIAVILFVFIFQKNKSSKLLIGVVVLLISTCLFALATTKNPFVTKPLFGIQQRDLFNQRELYIKQSIYAITHYPFFGVGSLNFRLLSPSILTPSEYMSTFTHNIILESLVSYGVPFSILLLIYAMSIIKRGQENKKISWRFLLILSLLVNFMFDYTYSFYSFFTLFIMTIAIESAENDTKMTSPLSAQPLIIIISIFLLSSVSLVFLSKSFFLTKNYWLSFLTNPLDKTTYVPAIDSELSRGNYLNSEKIIHLADILFPYEVDLHIDIGKSYLERDNKIQALEEYMKAYRADYFQNGATIKIIYDLTAETETMGVAKSFIVSHFLKLDKTRVDSYEAGVIMDENREICHKLIRKPCPHRF